MTTLRLGAKSLLARLAFTGLGLLSLLPSADAQGVASSTTNGTGPLSQYKSVCVRTGTSTSFADIENRGRTSTPHS
jgi:hypothetical protein